LIDERGARSRSCKLISTCVRLGEKYDETLTFEEACRLETRLMHELAKVVKSANNLDEKEKK
jgi:hypothetical protein